MHGADLEFSRGGGGAGFFEKRLKKNVVFVHFLESFDQKIRFFLTRSSF